MGKSKDANKGLGKAPAYLYAAALLPKGKLADDRARAPIAKRESAPVKPPVKREASKRNNVSVRFLEQDASENTAGNRFRVILIQEGLGNTKDGFFYTKEALKSAAPVFEGKKFFANHPDKIEEEVRPERSVEDVYGHFENLEFKEAGDGTGQLYGDVVVVPGGHSSWVREILNHAVQYAKKYPGKEFVGLSINAGGDAEAVNAEEFLREGAVVPSAKEKIQRAISEGLQQIRVVKTIDSAVSCDLVTEAGAKGKVLELLEANRMDEKVKKEAEEKAKKEAEEKAKKEADDKAAKDKGDDDGDSDGGDGHDDAEQDKSLIMDQLKKHGLVKDGDSKEESEKAHEAASKMHAAYKAAGHDSKEAASRAVEAMKCSAAVAGADGEKKEAEEKAQKEAEEAAKNHKEAAATILRLQGEIAALREKNTKNECEKHLDKRLQESKLPMAITKKFRESIKAPKSVKDVDEKLNLLMEGYKHGGEASGLESFVMTEKQTAIESDKGLDLNQFVEE